MIHRQTQTMPQQQVSYSGSDSPKARSVGMAASSTNMLVVFMCSLAAALSYCDRTNMSMAAVSMARHLHWTSSEKAKVLGSFFWGYLISQFLGATFSQKYGGRMVLGLAAVGWSVCTVVVPMLAENSIGLLVFGRFVLGVTEGVTFPAIYYLLRQHVSDCTRSRAVAMISIGTISGAVVSFLLSPILIHRYGWESVFFVFGGVFGPIFVILWFMVVPNSSKQMEYEPIKPENFEPNHDVESSNTPSNGSEKSMDYLSMLQHPVLASIFFAHFSHNLCHFALMSWLPTFLYEKLQLTGDSLAISSLPWIVMGMSISLSSTLADKLISRGMDRPFVRRMCTVSAFSVAGISMFCVALFTSSSTPYPFCTLFFLSIALAGNGAATAGGYESAKLDLTMTATAASRLTSLSNTLATFAGIVGIPLVASLKGENNAWENVFFGLTFTFFLAAFVFHTYGRWTGPIL